MTKIDSNKIAETQRRSAVERGDEELLISAIKRKKRLQEDENQPKKRENERTEFCFIDLGPVILLSCRVMRFLRCALVCCTRVHWILDIKLKELIFNPKIKY